MNREETIAFIKRVLGGDIVKIGEKGEIWYTVKHPFSGHYVNVERPSREFPKHLHTKKRYGLWKYKDE